MHSTIVESAAAEPQSLDTILKQVTPLEFVTILHNEFDKLFQEARRLSETSGINLTLINNLESASKAVSQVIGEVLKTQESTKEYQAIANQAIQAIEALRQKFSKNTLDVSQPTDYITPFTALQEIITKNQNLALSLSTQFENLRLPKSIPQREREIDIALYWTQRGPRFSGHASALVEKGLLLAQEILKKNKIVEQSYDKEIILQVSSELAKNKYALAQIQVGNAKTQEQGEEACASANQLYDFAVNESRQAPAGYNQAIDECRRTLDLAKLNNNEAEEAIKQAQNALERIKAQILAEQPKKPQAELESKNDPKVPKKVCVRPQIPDPKQSSWSTNNKILVGGSLGFFAGAGLGVGLSFGLNGFQEAILGLFINNVQECIANHPVVSIVMVSAICAVLALLLTSIITKLIEHCFSKSNASDVPNP